MPIYLLLVRPSAPAAGCTCRRMTQERRAGAVAEANEEAVRAWDTVLYERWKSNRKVFVGALAEVTEEVFELFPPPEGGRCIDIGCGFGETTQRLAELVGPEGFALGTDSSPRFIEDARREAAEAGRRERRVRDRRRADGGLGAASTTTPSRAWGRSSSPRRCPRCARSAARCKPGGRLAKICWRRKAREPVLGGDRAGRRAVPLAPGGVRGRHLRARAVLARQPRDHPRHPRGRRVRGDRAAPARLRLLHGRGHGRGGRLPARDRARRRADPPQRRRTARAAGRRSPRRSREHYAAWQQPDGSIVGRGSVWIVAATNPGDGRG